MANGISRRSVYEALKASTDRDGKLDLWLLAETLADDVESWGEDDFHSDMPSNSDAAPPRFWHIVQS